MIDTIESSTQGGPSRAARWLVLFHQLPPKPDYLRVKVRRRLQRIGAVALKNSIYALPFEAEALEDFQWLRREIVDAGGEVTLCASEFIEGLCDADVEDLFRRERAAEYAQVVEQVRALGADPSDREVARLRRQLRQIEVRDYFETPGKVAADAALTALEGRGRGIRAVAATADTSPARPTGWVWVTRQGIYVDRIASTWLISRFIDPAATFKFVPPNDYRPDPGEQRFDMFEGEFTHEGDACTFEVLLRRFGLDDKALAAIAEIVHDIDCKDDRYERDETDGIQAVLDGIALGRPSDEDRLALGGAVFDGLYERFRRRG